MQALPARLAPVLILLLLSACPGETPHSPPSDGTSSDGPLVTGADGESPCSRAGCGGEDGSVGDDAGESPGPDAASAGDAAGNADVGTPPTGTGTGMAVAGPNGVIDLTTSECFNKQAQKIIVAPDGLSAHPYMAKEVKGLTFDLRGSKFTGNPVRHPVLFNKVTDICIVGPTVVGLQPRSWSWSQVKTAQNPNYMDGDGVGWEDSHGRIIVEGAWIDNMEDGVGPPFDLVPDRSTTFSIRHTYMRYIRDDAIENDGCLHGELLDSFVDGTHTFLSTRPTKGVPTPGGHKLKVRDSIIRMSCQPDPRSDKRGTCPKGQGVLGLFKLRCAGTVDMQDTIIMLDGLRASNWEKGTYNNVTLIWGGSGSYPGTKPPPGVTVTKDKTIYDKARASWFKRHGCDQNGDNCSFIQQSKIGNPMPAPTKPVIQVQMSPAYVPDGNGGGVAWSYHNMKPGSCVASGKGFTPTNLNKSEYGSWHIKMSHVGPVTYKVECEGVDGKKYSDSYVGNWFKP